MMALSGDKLRKVVNMLAEPMQAHAAAHLLSVEAKERGVLVADLIAGALAPPPMATPSYAAPSFNDVSENPYAGIGKRINLDHYGLRAFTLHQTPKAWLVEGPSGESVWLPKSECAHRGEDPEGRTIFIVPMWLARKKGFPL
jgi:hypothetical protein